MSQSRQRVGRDLVGDDQPLEVAVVDPADLDLEVDEPDADAEEHAREKVVDPERQRDHVVDVLLARPVERDDVLLG